MKTLLKAVGLIFVGFLLCHWMVAGQDEILEGPPKDPFSTVQLSPK